VYFTTRSVSFGLIEKMGNGNAMNPKIVAVVKALLREWAKFYGMPVFDWNSASPEEQEDHYMLADMYVRRIPQHGPMEDAKEIARRVWIEMCGGECIRGDPRRDAELGIVVRIVRGEITE
jgi:hypothetical protein